MSARLVHEPSFHANQIERGGYERKDTCRLFLADVPLCGKWVLQVRSRRTKADWASFMRKLIDYHYKDAENIVLVLDILNTHTPFSFDEVFELARAWRLSQKLEVSSTPKHGSWLNMAEIELAILSCRCLSRRFSSLEAVQGPALRKEARSRKVDNCGTVLGRGERSRRCWSATTEGAGLDPR